MVEPSHDIAFTYRSLQQDALPYHEIARRKDYQHALARWPLLQLLSKGTDLPSGAEEAEK
ncbi:hypothetical protein IB286_01595 [Spongiibacter sp. KMU-158]|uniref:Cellulose biosynthesis protein BcsR n=1 Tax=Spongiibacter pelagi TaxID=2760804 RepID=A0A927C0M1_9GAMM|nr:BcsR/BcsP family cellulose biosynthesis protein [Spongiibacter pelagi]MBD2857682.1 hypothetical protein [Spongiibacter pelagi]